MKLRRDKSSNALINLDEDGYKQAKLRKQLQKKNARTEHQQQSMEFRIAEMEKRLEKLERIVSSMNRVKTKTEDQ